jgi:hypothetical protein
VQGEGPDTTPRLNPQMCMLLIFRRPLSCKRIRLSRRFLSRGPIERFSGVFWFLVGSFWRRC